ncbi:MAG: energy transducer TonB [Blastocatellia bacterium]
MARRSIRLENISVSAPCKADWNKMLGDDQVRFCQECKLNVYNLSGMSGEQAEDVVRAKEGNLCVRFYRRSDGTVLTQNCPVGIKAIKQKVARTATAIISATIAFFTGLGGWYNLQPNLELESPSSEQLFIGTPSPMPIEDKQANEPQGEMLMGAVIADTSVPPPPIDNTSDELVNEVPSLVHRSEGVIRGNAIKRVNPEYPALARNAHIKGDVVLSIVIDEYGKVINAYIVSGHPILQRVALEAARQWEFKPTLLNDTPVKVQGKLTFRFVL